MEGAVVHNSQYSVQPSQSHSDVSFARGSWDGSVWILILYCNPHLRGSWRARGSFWPHVWAAQVTWARAGARALTWSCWRHTASCWWSRWRTRGVFWTISRWAASSALKTSRSYTAAAPRLTRYRYLTNSKHIHDMIISRFIRLL